MSKILDVALDVLLIILISRSILDYLFYKHFQNKIAKIIVHHNNLVKNVLLLEEIHNNNAKNFIKIFEDFNKKLGLTGTIEHEYVTELQKETTNKKWGL